MLKCGVKFCGGCNPRYDRGMAYKQIANELKDIAVFSTVQENVSYDVLLIIRGCTACPYLYDEVEAKHRVICTSKEEISAAVEKIRSLAEEAESS